jgi:RNA polymerase sigma-70 factor (ECF subfamily)
VTREFSALFEAHAAFVWRVLRRHGVPERELEDASQEVFLVVHRRLPEFEARSTLRTWIYGIAARVALGLRRKAHTRLEHLRQLESDPTACEPMSQPTQLDEIGRHEALALIETALSELTPEKREVFALYELEGMSMAEVAAALGVPENTALYRLYNARDEIRAFVQRRRLRSAAPAQPLARRAVR